jgi:hypothetical protein
MLTNLSSALCYRLRISNIALALRTSLRTTLALLFIVCVVSANPAVKKLVKVGNEDIDINRDHLNVRLLAGWVSAKDSFFKALISDKSKLIITSEREAAFFDPETKLSLTSLYENKDVKKNTDVSWGQNFTLIDNLPADVSPSIKLQVFINRNNRLTQVFDAAEQSKALLPADIFTSQWFGYGKVLASLINLFFKADQPSAPFDWTGNIGQDFVNGNKISSHYIILIAPRNAADGPVVQALDASKLRYDENSSLLMDGADQLKDRSWVVLKVEKGRGFDIKDQLNNSRAPWAVLANSQFIFSTTSGLKNVEQLSTYSENILQQLKNEVDLLIREPRFSKFDRATALRGFALTAKGRIDERCSDLHIAAADCPSKMIAQYLEAGPDPSLKLPKIYNMSLDKESEKFKETLKKN